jgi:hypothetical protein
VRVRYLPSAEPSEGWLDYIEINARRRLQMTGQVMEFRDLQTLAQPAATFRLSGVNGPMLIWDITDRQLPKRQVATASGSTFEFGATTQGVLRNFVAFYDNTSLPKPEKTVGKIANQNIHGLDDLHMVIVYHQDFEAAAQQLAQHRRSFGGLDVATVRIDQLFNEFSSGAKDPTAMRDLRGCCWRARPTSSTTCSCSATAPSTRRTTPPAATTSILSPFLKPTSRTTRFISFPSDDYFALAQRRRRRRPERCARHCRGACHAA